MPGPELEIPGAAGRGGGVVGPAWRCSNVGCGGHGEVHWETEEILVVDLGGLELASEPHSPLMTPRQDGRFREQRVPGTVG